MRAVFVRPGGGGVEVRDVDVPEIGEGEILVRMRVCGIDGTDLEKAFGRPITPPMLGHEVAGEVVESKTSEFRPGDRVFVHHHVFCGRCYYCLHGSYTMCPLFLKTTIEPCGLAEYFRVPRTNVERGAVLKLPDNVGWEEAAFIEPSACVLRAINRAGFRPGDSVSIVGVGPTGAIFIRLLKSFGASVVAAADLSSFRLEAARRLGADIVVNPLEADFPEECRGATDGRGVDIGVLATPTVKPLQTVLDTIRKGGVLLIFGAPEKGEKAEIDFSKLFLRETNIVTSYSTSEVETNLMLSLIASGRVSLRDLITHRFRLEEAEEAFQTARDAGRSLKVVVEA